MMVSETEIGALDMVVMPDNLPPSLVAAAERNAAAVASQLRDLFESWGAAAADTPLEILLELAAIQMLEDWHSSGVLQFLNLPTPQEARELLASKLDRGWPEVESPGDHRVWNMVNSVFCSELAWDGPSELGAELSVTAAQDDLFLDVLAEFIWHNRHSLD